MGPRNLKSYAGSATAFDTKRYKPEHNLDLHVHWFDEDHNGNKVFDVLCNPRFIFYIYISVIYMYSIHCILLYMLMVDPIK